jgi:hypothetical protein
LKLIFLGVISTTGGFGVVVVLVFVPGLLIILNFINARNLSYQK